MTNIAPSFLKKSKQLKTDNQTFKKNINLKYFKKNLVEQTTLHTKIKTHNGNDIFLVTDSDLDLLNYLCPF